MTNTLIDIYNNILKYNNKIITVILDDSNIPWFSASDVANVLNYNHRDGKRAILTFVDAKYKKSFTELKKFLKFIPKNSQPAAIYINEFGLYEFLLESRKGPAKKFRRWVLEEVIPSIRKTGSYLIEQEYLNEIENINAKLKQSKKEIKILKHNQKKNNYKATGLIYIIRPIDATNKKLIKPGRTTDFNKRLKIYNTSVPNNMEILFTLEVDDPVAVENCIKALMSKYVYRKNKEYYECSVSKFKDAIIRCDKLVHDQYYCEKCDSRISSLDHFFDVHDINDDEKLYLDIVNDDEDLYSDTIQFGGNNNNNCVPILYHPRYLPKPSESLSQSQTIVSHLHQPYPHSNVEPAPLIDDSNALDILLYLPIRDKFALEKYCSRYCPFYVDKNQKLYYECPINVIKDLLFDSCQYVTNIDNYLNELNVDYNLASDDLVLLDVDALQIGGKPYQTSDDFEKNIVFKDDRFVLPNGVIVHHNGKVDDSGFINNRSN